MGKRNPADFDFLIGLYLQGMDGPTIERLYGVSSSTLYFKMEEAGIPRRMNTDVARRHAVNSAFFKVIDNELAAYWLGFLSADGHVTRKGHTVRLVLAARDHAHVAQFGRDIESAAPVRDRIDGGWAKALLCVHCLEMWQDLRSHGLATAQPQRALPIFADTHLRRHFIRGYFDGDGSVCLAAGHYYANICAQSATLITQIADVLREEVGIGCRASKHNTIELWYVRTGGTNQIRALGAWLYADATRWLERKKVVFDAIPPRRTLSYGPLSEAEFIALFPVKTNPELSALTGIPVSTLATRAWALRLHKIPSMRTEPLPSAWRRRHYQQ